MTQAPPKAKPPTSLYGVWLVIQRMEKSAKYQPSGALVHSTALDRHVKFHEEVAPK